MATESERRRDTRIRLTVFSWLEEQTRVMREGEPERPFGGSTS
jgi:hypothetical protein